MSQNIAPLTNYRSVLLPLHLLSFDASQLLLHKKQWLILGLFVIIVKTLFPQVHIANAKITDPSCLHFLMHVILCLVFSFPLFVCNEVFGSFESTHLTEPLLFFWVHNMLAFAEETVVSFTWQDQIWVWHPGFLPPF